MELLPKDYSQDIKIEIFNSTGYFFQIVSDPDGSGMVVLRYFNDTSDKKPVQEISIPSEIVENIYNAMKMVIENGRVSGL